MQNRKNNFLIYFIFIFILLTIYYFYHNTHIFHFNETTNSGYTTYEKAKIIDITDEKIEREKETGLLIGTQQLEIEITSGEYSGEKTNIVNYLSYSINILANVGDTIIVQVDTSSNGNYMTTVYSYNRAPYLFIFILVFFTLLIGIGGKKGLKSVIGLIFTFISILFLLIPMLYRGYSAIWSVILVSILTIFITLFLLNGWSIKTLSAIIGTSAGVVISGILSWIMGLFTHLSGFNMSNAETMLIITQNTGLHLKDLLFASTLIASLGAVMDLAMSIASSVYEVYSINKNISTKQLFNSGMNVGRDMMGTMANTLILAFAGSSLNLIIVLFSYNVSLSQLMNMNLVGIELIQGLSGSIAVVLTVPLVSFISSLLIHYKSSIK